MLHVEAGATSLMTPERFKSLLRDSEQAITHQYGTVRVQHWCSPSDSKLAWRWRHTFRIVGSRQTGASCCHAKVDPVSVSQQYSLSAPTCANNIQQCEIYPKASAMHLGSRRNCTWQLLMKAWGPIGLQKISRIGSA